MRAPSLLLLTLWLFACGGADAPVEPGGPKVLKVGTYNVRNNDDWWELRHPLIAEQWAALAPDLLGVQELQLDMRHGQRLAKLVSDQDPALTYALHEELKSGEDGFFGEGVGLFSRFPLGPGQRLDLSFGRVATFDRVDLGDGLTLDVYNTHLHHRDGDTVRLEQMQAVLAWVAQNDQGFPTVLTGDMNTRDTSPVLAAAREAGFLDSFREVHPDPALMPGNTSPVPLAQEPVTLAPTSRIDFVLVKPGASGGLRLLDSKVTFDRPAESGLYPSDHLGVLTELELDPRSP